MASSKLVLPEGDMKFGMDERKILHDWILENEEKYAQWRDAHGVERGTIRGWWGEDRTVQAYQWFETEEAAKTAGQEIERLARELTEQESRNYGRQCLRETAWCEARGLDADYLPEPDGPSDFYVLVSEGLPNSRRASRQWD